MPRLSKNNVHRAFNRIQKSERLHKCLKNTEQSVNKVSTLYWSLYCKRL